MKKLFLLVLLVAALAVLWWRSDSGSPQASPPPGEREIEFIALEPEPEALVQPGPTRVSEPLARPLARVRGRCVDARGRPLAGVELECAFPPARATSDDSGRFELELELLDAQAQRAAIVARGRGLGVLRTEIELEGGAQTTLSDWMLTPAAVLRGTVRDAAGAPLAGIEVRCTAAEFACPGACATPRGAVLCATTTDERGAFELDSAPAGEWCVWAGDYGRTLWVSTPRLQVRAGEVLDGLELVTPLVARESLLGVRVVDPRGQPVAGAQILYRFHDATRGGSGLGEADESGRWILAVAQRAPHTVLARDPRGRFQPTALAALAPGVIDVPLMLGRPQRVELRVVDENGAAQESFALRLAEATSEELAPGVAVDPLVLVDEPERARPGGRVLLDAPSCPFELTLRAAGAFELRAGPFAAEQLSGGIELVLRRPPGVTGQVISNGAGLAGATVSLHAAAAEGVRYGDALASATSDENGGFALPCEHSGSFWIRASALDLAASDLGPLEIDPKLGSRGNVLELTRGGAIKGAARPAHGESAADVTVTARRGDGFDRTTRTDESGAFEFDALTPGAWVLERSAPPATSPLASAPMAAVRCEVTAGAVTQVELPAPDAGLAVLSGELAFDGTPAVGWSAEVDGRVARTNENGAFELAALLPGLRRIVLTAPAHDGASLRIEGEVLLRIGANPWRLDQRTGRIQGRLKQGASSVSGPLRWSWRGDGEWSASGASPIDASGAFTIPAAPAGRIELRAGDAPPVQILLDATATVDIEL